MVATTSWRPVCFSSDSSFAPSACSCAGSSRSEASATRPESVGNRSEENTSELQSLMRISYAVFCWKNKKNNTTMTKSSELLLQDDTTTESALAKHSHMN